jgi:hypothetical protein
MSNLSGPAVQVVRLTFRGSSVALANQDAQEFLVSLRSSSRDFTEDTAQLFKDDPDTQDLGSTLILILSSAAVVQLAKGLRDVMPKLTSRFELTTKDGLKVIARGDAASNLEVARLVEAIEGAEARRLPPVAR